MKRKVAETPPMTVKELREYLQARPTRDDALETLEDMKVWYFDNCHLITVGEDTAFSRYIGELQRYTEAQTA